MLRLLPAVALCLLFVPLDARAQRPASVSAAAALLNAEGRTRLVEKDTLLDFRTRAVPGGRYDVEAGVLRAAYRIEAAPAGPAAPETAARAYLTAEAARFGWRPAADDLVLDTVVAGRYTRHVVFQQTFSGLPVYNRRVKVSLDAQGRPTMVLSGYAPHLSHARPFDPAPRLSPAAAAARVRQLVAAGEVQTTEPQLVVYPSAEPRLAWRLAAWPASLGAEWEALVDAHTGEVIHLLDQSIHHASPETRHPEPASGSGREAEPRDAHPETRAVPSEARSAQPATPLVDGSGLVFDPDPLTTAGVPYGVPYSDQGDADVPELNAERVEVALRDITQGTDGLYRLEGPYVRIDGGIGAAYTPPAEPDPNGFRYGRANPFFEAVMAYYHVDKSQRYVQSLDAGRDIANRPTPFNPHGLGNQDASEYRTNQKAIVMGRGGIDDAEDGEVIWHEYAHALLDDSVPGLLGSTEGAALHEGWADYWATSYTRWLVETGQVPARDWRQVFDWDANETWCGRYVGHPGRYPDQVAYPDAPCSVIPKYAMGLLWATTLMEIYPLVGRGVLDRLNLASHGYLISPATFADAAEALLQADVDLYGGDHASVLLDVLGRRGYVDPGRYAPVAAHEPLPATEQLGGTLRVEVFAEGEVAPVDSVLLFYDYAAPGAPSPSLPRRRLVLADLGGGRYGGDLPLPEAPARVVYYVEVADTRGARTRLPAAAPAALFGFETGPDLAAPQIVHAPQESVSLAGWPLELTATVEDALGVDTVYVDYRITDRDGVLRDEGQFGLRRVEGGYFGRFPTDAAGIEEGSIVQYRVLARDRSAAGNVATLPGDGFFSVEVVAEGVLRAYGFEGIEPGITASGSWQRGAPAYGLTEAHGGRQVWSTALTAAYPEQAQRSSLELPPMSLPAGVTTYLVFWHWYDFEHSGHADPAAANPDAVFWDGANVRVSTDGGRTWNVLDVEGGYPGRIAPQTSGPNPLAGQPGFGGYSYGWRRVVARLPAGADVRIRFDSGTDAENQSDTFHGYAGWALDDVSVTTQRPSDATAPEASALPPPRLQRPAGSRAPTLTVQASDDTGVEAVWVDYTVEPGARAGALRLAMNPSAPDVFSGRIWPDSTFAPGARISYRVRLRDFDGNERFYPEAGAFEVVFLTMASADALVDVRPSGLWRPTATGWSIAPGTTTPPPSSLVLAPIDVPENAAEALFVLEHAAALGAGAGANVKLSADDGATWTLLVPREGYARTLPGEGSHPMAGEGVLGGSGEASATFDLTPYAGRQVRLRIDFGAGRALLPTESFRVDQASVALTTGDEQFGFTRQTRLHANFPDPFAGQTTITYTIAEALAPVRVSVYDVLGRRVAVLVHAEHVAGTYTLGFDASGLAGGLYFVLMETPEGQYVEKMTVAR